MVISKWDYDKAQEDQVREAGHKMMSTIRSWEGVEFAYNVRTAESSFCSVIAYRDEDTYQRLINDPEGPFVKAAAEHEIEKNAHWNWSERGEVEGEA